MFFVFIVEISKLLKTGSGHPEFPGFYDEQGCAQDGPGAHRIELGVRLTADVDPEAGSRIAEA